MPTTLVPESLEPMSLRWLMEKISKKLEAKQELLGEVACEPDYERLSEILIDDNRGRYGVEVVSFCDEEPRLKLALAYFRSYIFIENAGREMLSLKEDLVRFLRNEIEHLEKING